MAKERPGIMMYWPIFENMSVMNGEQLKEFIAAVYRYARYGEIPCFKCEGVNLVWPSVQSSLDQDMERYLEKIKAREDAGRKGGIARAENAKQNQANQANATFANQTKPISISNSESISNSFSISISGQEDKGCGEKEPVKDENPEQHFEALREERLAMLDGYARN